MVWVRRMNHKFSFIIPVYRENQLINAVIDHIRQMPQARDVEIIVVDGERTGDTVREIDRVDVRKIAASKGRGNQMNAGAAQASGDVLIFLHADTRLPPQALVKIAAAFENEKIVGGAFDLGIDSTRFAFRLIEKMASLRSRLTRVPYGDQAIFLRRAYFQDLGGYPNIPIMEDVELMRRIKHRGGRIALLKDTVQTSPRRWEAEGILLCTLRNWFIITLYLLGAKPETLVKFYR